FRYRLSNGREVNWGMTDDSTPKPFAGGVLWSVGPDGIDHGGRNAGHWQGWAGAGRWEAQQLDAVFLVPFWGEQEQRGKLRRWVSSVGYVSNVPANPARWKRAPPN